MTQTSTSPAAPAKPPLSANPIEMARATQNGAPAMTTSPTPQTDNQERPICVETRDLQLHYGPKHALKGINARMATNSISALIGPSGCGKSTFLRCLNRMNDLIENVKIDGEALLHGENIYARGIDVVALRQRVGMVFQKPNPFPMSIFDNVAYGPRLRGMRNKSELARFGRTKSARLRVVGRSERRIEEERVGFVRRTAATFVHRARVGDAARSAVDGRTVFRARPDFHAQSRRIDARIARKIYHRHRDAQYAASRARFGFHRLFFCSAQLVEMDASSKIFTDPGDKRTEDYITGRFG